MSRSVSFAAATRPPAPSLLTPWRALAIVGGLVLMAVLPFVVKNFFVFQITLAVIYAIAILGLNLLTGLNGQFSLGHSAFYAIGAYTAAIMMNADIDYWWTLPAAGAVCFVSGFLFGLPALRLEGIYLALATFALAVATPQLLKVNFLEDWTGGVQGISVTKPDAPEVVDGLLRHVGLRINSDQWLYFFTIAVAALLYLGAVNLAKSRTGRALVAIRDHPVAASAMGINVPLYKSLTFGVSALYTGVAGALGALAISFVAPDSFTINLAIGLFVGLVVGGVDSIFGTLIGGAFVLFVPNIAEWLAGRLAVLVPNLADQAAKGLTGAVYGVILLLLIYLMPSGAAGLGRWLAGCFVRRTPALQAKLATVTGDKSGAQAR